MRFSLSTFVLLACMVVTQAHAEKLTRGAICSYHPGDTVGKPSGLLKLQCASGLQCCSTYVDKGKTQELWVCLQRCPQYDARSNKPNKANGSDGDDDDDDDDTPGKVKKPKMPGKYYDDDEEDPTGRVKKPKRPGQYYDGDDDDDDDDDTPGKVKKPKRIVKKIIRIADDDDDDY